MIGEGNTNLKTCFCRLQQRKQLQVNALLSALIWSALIHHEFNPRGDSTNAGKQISWDPAGNLCQDLVIPTWTSLSQSLTRKHKRFCLNWNYRWKKLHALNHQQNFLTTVVNDHVFVCKSYLFGLKSNTTCTRSILTKHCCSQHPPTHSSIHPPSHPSTCPPIHAGTEDWLNWMKVGLGSLCWLSTVMCSLSHCHAVKIN